MINNIEYSIREYFEQNNSRKLGTLFFLKYNTPISGTGIGTKVLFFVFEDDRTVPLCVVKTVRSDRDSRVIVDGSSCLQLLSTSVHGSPIENSFPQLLFLQTDGIPFSVESFCIGDRAVYSRDVQKILDAYIVFAQQIQTHSHGTISIDTEYAKELINALTGSTEIKHELLSYTETLFSKMVITVPRIMQHGDLTPDNCMFRGDTMCMVDCDLFGVIQIPGFDIYHLLSKRSTPVFLHNSLEAYYRSLNIDVSISKALLFVFYLHELHIKKDYILVGKTSKEIIEKFEEMVVSRL